MTGFRTKLLSTTVYASALFIGLGTGVGAGQSFDMVSPSHAAAMNCHPANPCAPKNQCVASNPCGPCGAAPEIELTVAESIAAYSCIKAELTAGYAKSGDLFAANYQAAERYSKVPYQSFTHGNRFVNNYTNAEAYGRFEESDAMPQGTQIAKDSFVVSPNGDLSGGPLFLMEKMGLTLTRKQAIGDIP